MSRTVKLKRLDAQAIYLNGVLLLQGTNVGLNPRGPFAPNTAYAAFDWVHHAGSSYYRLVPGTSGATFNVAQWQPLALRGLNGWEPITANEPDGNRIVQRVVGWFGGDGTPPTESGFIGPTGFVATAALATDIRGIQGQPGAATGGGMSYQADPTTAPSTHYLPILTLPPTTAGTLDSALVVATLGAWTLPRQQIRLTLGQRDAFWYSYTVEGVGSPAVSLEAYRNANGSTTLYVRMNNTFNACEVHVPLYTGTQVQVNSSLVKLTGAAPGTKIFDSGNPALYPPATANSELAFNSLPVAQNHNPADTQIVVQQGKKLQKADFPRVAKLPPGFSYSIGSLGQNGNIMALILGQYADTWQNRTAGLIVEKWVGGVWVAATTAESATFRQMMRGRTLLIGMNMAPGVGFRVTITTPTATYGRMLVITTQYANPVVDATVMLEHSGNGGTTWNTILPSTAIAMRADHYIPTEVTYFALQRITIIANADADSTKLFHLGGMSFLSDRVSAENPNKNTLPFTWDENGDVKIGENIITDPHPSAVLELASSSRGFLMPRVSQAQRTAIQNPANGLLIYQVDGIIGIWVYDENNTWSPLISRVRSYTPTSATDANLLNTHMCADDNFLYRKNSGAIKKIAWTNF